MWLLICLVIKNVIELFFRGRRLNISVVFTTECYLAIPKYIRLNSTNYFVMKILNKRELEQIAFNHSSGTDFQDFVNLYKKCTVKPYSFWLLILLFHHIVFYLLERIFQRKYKVNHYNMILTEKQEKYQHHHPKKLVTMNIKQINKYYHLVKVE